MVREDSYTPNDSMYECLECGNRTATDNHPGACPSCGGDVWNIAVPRE